PYVGRFLKHRAVNGSDAYAQQGCDFSDGRSSQVHIVSLAPIEYGPTPAQLNALAFGLPNTPHIPACGSSPAQIPQLMRGYGKVAVRLGRLIGIKSLGYGDKPHAVA